MEETLKEKVIKAILEDKFSDEELEFIYSKTFYEKKLVEAMTIISTMEITDGFLNDAYYSNIMEGIEEMRESYKKQLQNLNLSKTSPYKNNTSNNEHLTDKKKSTNNKNHSKKQSRDTKVNKTTTPLKKRNISEETKEKLRNNAAIARAAKDAKREAEKKKKQ